MNTSIRSRTQTYLNASIILIAIFAAALVWLPAFADPPELITICHAAGQEGTTQYVTLTLPYPAVYGPAGHFNEDGTTQAGHEQDYLGTCITEDPTDEPQPTPTISATPTPTPTEEPGPSPTPTEPEGQPTPTPVATDIEPTPTNPPPVTPELPQTGDGLGAETWLCWGTNVYCSHNGVPGAEGELWVFLYPGTTITVAGSTYVVQNVQRVAYDQVSVLDRAGEYDVVAITCTLYSGGIWLERVVIFANLSP